MNLIEYLMQDTNLNAAKARQTQRLALTGRALLDKLLELQPAELDAPVEVEVITALNKDDSWESKSGFLFDVCPIEILGEGLRAGAPLPVLQLTGALPKIIQAAKVLLDASDEAS